MTERMRDWRAATVETNPDMRVDAMTKGTSDRAHLIAGSFPLGAGHDHDHARLRLLGPSVLTRGLPSSVVGEDEPYFIELQHPASTRIVLSADCAPDVTSPTIGALYASDTSLLPDGKTRALGSDPMDTSPLTFRGSWEPEFFTTRLKNASPWGLDA
jgi:hypothetical protein